MYTSVRARSCSGVGQAWTLSAARGVRGTQRRHGFMWDRLLRYGFICGIGYYRMALCGIGYNGIALYVGLVITADGAG